MDKDPKTPQQDHIVPLNKTDWIRFGALKLQAKSMRVWQFIAILAIGGLITAIVTYTWLYMDQGIRSERASNQILMLLKDNQTLRVRMNSVNDALKKYTQMVRVATTEKDQLTVENGILDARVGILEDLYATQMKLMQKTADYTEYYDIPVEGQ